MNARRWAFAVTVAVLSLAVIGCGSPVGRAPALTADQLAIQGISNATDLTDLPDGSYPALPVTKQQAIALAKADLGTTDPIIGVLLGRRRTPLGPEGQVWVVVFPGGNMPGGEPSGAPPQPQRTSTVPAEVFEALTGDFVVGFMQ